MNAADEPAAQYHFTPDTYGEMIRADLPRYDELQAAAIDAIPFAPARVLELGFGTAETTRRIWERYPDCRITGIDSTSEMVFRARELGWEKMRLGRMEDPLPDGPWDLVIAVLSVHHLDEDAKRDLFRRVRQQSRALVIGDVVEVSPEQRVASLTPGFDQPSPAADQAEWCGGEVVWQVEDLAVIRAVYGA
jgi:tRNA (cmo5U34)-methyltransferase